MKHLTNFSNKSQYILKKPNLDKINVSYIENTKENIYGTVGWKNKSDAEPGDILVFYEGEKRVISPDKWYPGLGEPIGVVYCPASLVSDHTPRAISLVNMSWKTPESGCSIAGLVEGVNMTWGPMGDTVTNLSEFDPDEGHKLPIIGNNYQLYQDASGWSGYLSSDQFSNKPSKLLDETIGLYFYSTNDSLDYWADPNDLDEGGIANPYSLPELYFQTGTPTSDIDGYGNTQKIIAQMISNNGISSIQEAKSWLDDSASYPPATCCSLFETPGTSSGNWYLPSVGELGIFTVYQGKINRTLLLLEKQGRAVQVVTEKLSRNWPGQLFIAGNNQLISIDYFGTYYGDCLWSSTQVDEDSCWCLNLSESNIFNNDKSILSSNNRTRASLKF